MASPISPSLRKTPSFSVSIPRRLHYLWLMIKNTLLTMLLCVACSACLLAQAPAPAPQMTVVHVAGQVSLTADSKPLAVGQSLGGTDVIAFARDSKGVVVWQPATGLVYLKPKEALAGADAQLTGAAASFVTPMVAPTHPPRLEHFASTAQLKPHFQGRKYLLLGKSWLIADPSFPLAGDTLLMVKFRNLSANVQVSRRLEYSRDTLLLDPKLILDMNGKPVDAALASDFRLWWYHKPTNTYDEITYLQFVFADEAQLKSEIQVLLAQMQDQPATVQDAAVRLLIETCYGEPDAHNYKAWTDRYFPGLRPKVVQHDRSEKAPNCRPSKQRIKQK